MSWNYNLHPAIQLHVPDRIQREDADRQTRTATAILSRLHSMPGQILADEVGMGKTFVALAVALSVALQDKEKRPVVVMVPPGLKEKWPKELNVFKEKCIQSSSPIRIDYGIAENNVQFLKLLDDPFDQRKQIIFLTHSALTRNLTDKWLKLAIIQRALYRRKDERIAKVYKSLNRFGVQLFGLVSITRGYENLIEQLLEKDTSKWKQILIKADVLETEDDDPVPQQILDILYDLPRQSFDELLQVLFDDLPTKDSDSIKGRLRNFRKELNDALHPIWGLCLAKLTHSLPLLIMDEAHHLKNSKTNIARLFQESDPDKSINDGQLHNVFERMLFLTATPFQLGHHELCSILERFKGIHWQSAAVDGLFLEQYAEQLEKLRAILDTTQETAVRFDNAWGLLKPVDLELGGQQMEDVAAWWKLLQSAETDTLNTQQKLVKERHRELFAKMKVAEEELKKYVARHLRTRELTGKFSGIARRAVLPGSSIVDGQIGKSGIRVDNGSLLPFLLATRLSSLNPEARPVFAEGLASSYEAFLYTRKKSWDADPTDLDEDNETKRVPSNRSSERYLEEIEFQVKEQGQMEQHPKLGATVKKVVELWTKGEKVLIFCHYLKTGDSLWQAISNAMRNWIEEQAALKLNCSKELAEEELTRIGNRFDEGYRMRNHFDARLLPLIQEFDVLKPHQEKIRDVIIRYFRTPSFLVRYFPIGIEAEESELLDLAFNQCDSSGISLLNVIQNFLQFLGNKCGETEREKYLAALSSIQTGEIKLRRIADEDNKTLPNVRLVTGSTEMQTRQNLMLTFNTPFYPDVMIATSVMAEGVDLHLNCRYIIHHDLCWNPSTLEQRTGRIDRIGAKAELCGQPINIYLPYISETQDEKMYNVVMDRARWFNILMGEDYKEDLETTEKLAERLELPEEIVKELAFRLEV